MTGGGILSSQAGAVAGDAFDMELFADKHIFHALTAAGCSALLSLTLAP